MAADRRILRVGLTGNIGAGKSTVAGMLREHGCLVIDADALARRLLDAGGEVVDEIVARLGEEMVDGSGAIDRAALARRVFGDADARAALEAITHPRIRAMEEAEVTAWETQSGIAVTEAALLVETRGAARYDRLLVVIAGDEERLERLLERGMERDDVLRRMAAQLPQAEKAAVADHVIDNGGRLERTRARVGEVMRALETDLEAL